MWITCTGFCEMLQCCSVVAPSGKRNNWTSKFTGWKCAVNMKWRCRICWTTCYLHFCSCYQRVFMYRIRNLRRVLLIHSPEWFFWVGAVLRQYYLNLFQCAECPVVSDSWCSSNSHITLRSVTSDVHLSVDWSADKLITFISKSVKSKSVEKYFDSCLLVCHLSSKIAEQELTEDSLTCFSLL